MEIIDINAQFDHKKEVSFVFTPWSIILEINVGIPSSTNANPNTEMASIKKSNLYFFRYFNYYLQDIENPEQETFLRRFEDKKE